MKNLSKRFVSMMLAFAIVLSPVSSVSATNTGSNTQLKASTGVVNISEERAKSQVESFKSDLRLSNEVNSTNKEQEKVRVVIEVSGSPLILSATAQKSKVSDLAKSQIEKQEAQMLKTQKAVETGLNRVGIETKVFNNMTAIINAFSAEVKFADIEKIKEFSGVENVFISNEYERPEMITSKDQVSAKQAWDLGYGGEGTVLAVLDSGIDPSHKDFVLDDDVEEGLTKSDIDSLLEEENLPGKYYTEKVPYAYNYYDLNDNVKDYGDSQHGQHVAGTMAANGDESNGGIKGVAPDAQLLGMKVFSSDIRYATTFSDIYVKAIDDAIKLGADAINMSLGSPAGFYLENGLEQRVITNAQNNGIVTTISAGNERNIVNGWTKALGENPDTGVLGSPSANKAAFSIAAFENSGLLTAVANILPDEVNAGDIVLTEASGAPEYSTIANDEGFTYEFVGKGTADEFSKVNVEGKIAVAIRGNTFADTIVNGMKAGAVGVLVYNHAEGGDGIVNMAGGDGATIPFAFMGNTSGLKLVEAKEANPEVKIKFNKNLKSVSNPEGNKMGVFSSWGPTPDLQLKPELTAPGGNIYSTQNDDKYTTMSGTSMAAPHAAGGVGVVRQFVDEKIEEGIFPDLTQREKSDFVQLLLMNTADVKSDPTDSEIIFTPREQGAGLMNLAKATTNFVTVVDNTKGRTSFGEGKLELGEVGEAVSSTLKVKNYDTKPVTITPKVTLLLEYSLSEEDVQFLSEAYGMSKEQVESILGKTGSLQEYADIVYEEELDSFTLEAGSEDTFPVTLDLKDIPQNRFVEGFVTLEKSDGQVLSVPFLGFKGEWDSLRIVDTFDASNLLEDPSAADDSVRVVNPLQPSQFQSSGFYQSGMIGVLISDPNKVLLAPSNVVYNMFVGISEAAPIVSQLRNAKTMKYKVLDKDGNELRLLDISEGVRKIYKLDQGASPFRLDANAVWDGTVDGKVVKDGSYIYRIESVIDYPNARPQFDDFHFVVDDTRPDFVRNEEGEIEYTFDESSKVVTFKAHDILPEGLTIDDIAGLQSITIYNSVTNTTEVVDIDEFNLVDEEKGIYEVSVDLDDYLQVGLNDIEISLTDEAWNTSRSGIFIGPEQATVLDESAANIYLTSPELLAFYGDDYGDGSTKDVEVEVEGYVYGWDSIDSITFNGEEIPFTEKEIKISDPAIGIEYSGPGFEFSGTVKLTEGYKEPKLEVKSAGHTDFSIVRRLWVDLHKPTVSRSEVVYTEQNSADVKFDVHDNLHYIKVSRNGSVLEVIDNSDEYGFAADASLEFSETVSGLKDGVNSFVYDISDYLYNTQHTAYVVKGELNIDELVDAISDGESIVGEFYQPSLDKLNEAIEEGKALLESGNPTQEEIDAAAQKIRDAIDALTAPASEELKEELKALVEETEALNEDIITEETLAPLKDAYEKALEVLENPEATDKDVYDALLALRSALDSIEYKDIAPEIVAEDKTVFVGDTLDLSTMFTATDKLGNSVEVSVSGEVDTNTVGEYEVTGTAVSDGLESSKTALVKVVENDKTALNELIAKAEEELTNELYSGKSLSVLGTALEKAKAVSENINSTKAEISKAIEDLDSAIKGLVIEQVVIEDKVPRISGIDKTVGVGSSLELETLFKAETPDGKTLPVEVSGDVDLASVGVYELTGKTTFEGATNTAVATLTVVENDKTGLDAAIVMAEHIDLDKYTDESVAKLNEALELAKDVRTNINATMREIISASKSLLDATRALELASVENEDLPVVDTPETIEGFINYDTNMRQTPNGEVIATIPAVTEVSGTLEGNWVKLSYNGKEGYVWKDLVYKAPLVEGFINYDTNIRQTPNGEVIATIPAVTKVSGTLEGNWVKLSYNGKEGYVWKDLVYANPLTVEGYLSSATNLRETPNGKILLTIPAYAHLTGTQEGNWVKVSYNGSTGYVYRSLIADELFEGFTSSSVNVRNKPNGEVLGTLGKNVLIKGTKNSSSNWLEISFENKKGYVYFSLLKEK